MFYKSCMSLGLTAFFFMAAFFYGNPSALAMPPCNYWTRHCWMVCSKGICERTYSCIACWTGSVCPPCQADEHGYDRSSISPALDATEKQIPKRKFTPSAAGEKTYEFTHTLEGEWDDVVGYVGFPYKDKTNNKDYIACLIGLAVDELGNGQYKSEVWDKKVFWIDVGDGPPMHVCAIYAPNYEEDGVAYDNVYWSPNFVYQQPGTQNQKVVVPCDMWMYLDEDDEVEEVWIEIYNEDGETTKTKELGIGDQIASFLPAIDANEAGSFYAIFPEERFQTVKKTPIFLYEHMTPNVDFTYEPSKGIIDFEDTDLLFILYGESVDENDTIQYAFSTPKNLGMKWGDKPAKAENWFTHEVSSIVNFFLPRR